MLRKISVCLLAAFAVAALASAQTADELIEKNIQAHGGLDKIKGVQSMRMTGKIVGGGMEMPMLMEFKRPTSMRMEFTVQGMTGIQGYDGTTGWAVMPFVGKTEPEKMSPEDLKEMENQADIDGPLVDYKAKGHQVEYLGKADVEGTPVHKLKVTKKNGDVVTI
jgi:outer membrane lipoprotein-sorting protein